MIVRRLGVWSVAKLYAAITASMGLLIGLCIALVSMVAGASAMGGEGSRAVPMFGAMMGVGAIIGAPIVYGVMGLIGGAIGAALYNLFAGIVGGVELDVQ